MTTASPGPSTATALTARRGASAETMLATVHELAADRYAGRRIGTPGGKAAAAWLADQLRAVGAAVTPDAFEVTGVKELQSTPALAVGPRNLVHRRDFAEQLTSAEVPVPRSGPLAPAETGSWHGRWVLVAGADQQTVDRARTEAAAGLLVPRGADEAGWMPKMIAGPPTGPVAILSVRTDLHAALAHNVGQMVTASVPMRTIATTGTNVHGVFAQASPSSCRWC